MSELSQLEIWRLTAAFMRYAYHCIGDDGKTHKFAKTTAARPTPMSIKGAKHFISQLNPAQAKSMFMELEPVWKEFPGLAHFRCVSTGVGQSFSCLGVLEPESKTLFVTFRGSAQIVDFVNDAWPYMESVDVTKSGHVVRCHQGFMTIWNETLKGRSIRQFIIEEIMTPEKLKPHDVECVVFSGHSLGGALSHLAIYNWYKESERFAKKQVSRPDQKEFTTWEPKCFGTSYGAVAVGNKAFQSEFTANLNIPMTEFVNSWDGLSRLFNFGYQHHSSKTRHTQKTIEVVSMGSVVKFELSKEQYKSMGEPEDLSSFVCNQSGNNELCTQMTESTVKNWITGQPSLLFTGFDKAFFVNSCDRAKHESWTALFGRSAKNATGNATAVRLLQAAGSDSCIPSFHSASGTEYHLYDQCVRTTGNMAYDVFDKVRTDYSIVFSLWNDSQPKQAAEGAGYRLGDWTRYVIGAAVKKVLQNGPSKSGMWKFTDMGIYNANHATEVYQRGVENFVAAIQSDNVSKDDQRYHQSSNIEAFGAIQDDEEAAPRV